MSSNSRARSRRKKKDSENIKVIHLKINDQNMDKQTNKLIGTFDDTLTAMELDFN